MLISYPEDYNSYLKRHSKAVAPIKPVVFEMFPWVSIMTVAVSAFAMSVPALHDGGAALALLLLRVGLSVVLFVLGGVLIANLCDAINALDSQGDPTLQHMQP